MIRIKKPRKAPSVLANEGKAKCLEHCNDYDIGKIDFKFASKIYAHKSVKAALIAAQFGKCFACESKFTHIAFGDVEHFRPKAGYKQRSKDKLQKPGYYWLAYEWANLFASCQLCNQKFKKNLFPLSDPNKRAKSHKGKINLEDSLLIDPAKDNPQKFISFRKEVPYAIDNKPKGKATIEIFGLDRDELNEYRLKRYLDLKYIYFLANAEPPQPLSEEAKAYINKVLNNDSEEYAAIAWAAIASRFSII